jgi:hypothetical protein
MKWTAIQFNLTLFLELDLVLLLEEAPAVGDNVGVDPVLHLVRIHCAPGPTLYVLLRNAYKIPKNLTLNVSGRI